MNARQVPRVPPRPIFAIVVAVRDLLVRLRRRLAPPEVVMFESMFQGLQTVHIARAACELGLPEHLANGPRTLDDLALASGTKPELLARFLRTLASYEILVQHGDSRYALAPLGRTLLPGSVGSMRGAVLMGGSRWMQNLWHALPETLRTGKTGFEIAYGCGSWKYFADHPDARRDFDEAMVNLTTTDAPSFARAVDFSKAKRVCDVGGGRGTLLAHVLAQHPHLEGVLFDSEEVVGQARPVLDMWGVTERVQLVDGDFFVSVPAGCDVYFLRQVIHDWDDAQAMQILRTVRAAMQPGQRVLLYEMLRPEPVSQHPVFSLDLMMLVADQGRERTLAEMQALLTQCGFQPGHVTLPAAPLGIIEGTAV